MICFPNAKLNLGLNVVAKRPDGYHDIETVFYPIPLRDALEVVGAPAFAFHPSGIAVDAPAGENLVVKALHLLEKDYPLPELEVHLLKAIPSGAGLGGGSSDAAFMLRLLNDYAHLGLTAEQLEAYASRLGADCPFFIRNRPVFATGTGNVFTPVDVSLKGWHLCLVKPDVAVSTAAAYAMLTPRAPEVSLMETIRRPVGEWKETLTNDFEAPIFRAYPAIRELKETLYRAGAAYAAMSGSGSAVFALFNHPTNLKSHFAGCFVWEGAVD